MSPHAAAMHARRVGTVALLLVGSMAAAETVEVTAEHGRIELRVTDAPLRSVLEAIGRECDLDVRSYADLEQPVTIEFGPVPTHEALRRLLRDHSYMLLTGDRAQAVWILAPSAANDPITGWTADFPALDSIVVDLSHPDPGVREEAVLSLGDIGGRSVVPFLTQSLLDTSLDVRLAAEAVLDDLGSADYP